MKWIWFVFAFAFAEGLLASPEYLVKVQPQAMAPFFSQSPLSKRIRDDVYLVRHLEPETIKKYSGVVYLEPNHSLALNELPNDLDPKQWGILNTDCCADSNVSKAWQSTTGSSQVVVAVIDTGADINHPDLKDNIWQNEKESQGLANVDDDQNGFVDDIHGWNIQNNSNDVSDSRNHGTHVSGIIGAKGNNGQGITGVNWDVRLMIVNIFPSTGEGTVAHAIQAIDYAVENGAQIINASWGQAKSETSPEEFRLLEEAIARAYAKNILFVAAAGNNESDNDQKPYVPANLDVDNIVSVGAIASYGWKPDFSNYGKKTVDVFAPGALIKSTYPRGLYGFSTGTSMAAPFISGIAGLMLAKEPALTVDAIKNKLHSSCTPNSNLKDACICGGHIDAEMALQNL